MGPRRGRHGNRRHFQPRAGAIGRHRLRRGARGGPPRFQRPGSGRGRIGQGGVGCLCAGLGRGDRRQFSAERRSFADQYRPRGAGLVFQIEARQPARARRPDGRGRIPRFRGDTLSQPTASTSKWDAADYAKVGAFVAELGGAALDLIDPQPGERILDVGCGEGTLTRKIIERGATVLGIDNSPEMIAAARANGVDAVQLAAEDMQFFAKFDAGFSNATLHWVLHKEQAARAIFRALKPGGRFAGEMGGEGNLANLRDALDDELIIRGYVPPAEASNWYASPDEFAAVYEAAGFREIDARLIERPTVIDHGVAAWVTTFRKGWLDRAAVPEAERADIGAAVADRVGSNVADYVRLRFIMRKPA